MTPEPKRNLDTVNASSGLGQELEENCRRYTDDRDKLTCIKSSRTTLSLVMNGMNEESRRQGFKAASDLKNAKNEIKERIEETPERIPTPKIKTRDGKPPKRG